jgi:AraC family transcriptional regulator, positive regulator of tynA and feaB
MRRFICHVIFINVIFTIDTLRQGKDDKGRGLAKSEDELRLDKNNQPGVKFQRISTQRIPPKQRFDYWKSLHPRVSIQLPERKSYNDYAATLLHYAAPDGTTFGHTACDDTVTRFSSFDNDFVMLSLTLSGRAELADRSDKARTIAPSSGIVLIDSASPMSTTTHKHSHLYLTIPRTRVVDAIGGNLSALKAGGLTLPRQGMASFLESHLQMMAKHGETLDAPSAALVMKVATDLALGALSQSREKKAGIDEDRYGDALFAAACRFVRMETGARNLTASDIAEELGCSRAHLYRAFERHETNIGELVRTERLEMAKTLLVSRPAIPIKRIASLCGYSGSDTLARAFRHALGMTPGDYRALRWSE